MVAGPEITSIFKWSGGGNDNGDDGEEELSHYEEGYASQHRFLRHVKDSIEVLLTNENPFEKHSVDLVVLHNKVCESETAALSARKIESVVQKQYNNLRQSAGFKRHISDSTNKSSLLYKAVQQPQTVCLIQTTHF